MEKSLREDDIRPPGKAVEPGIEWFLPVGSEIIPDNSILREFVGGSNLGGFRGWQESKYS